MMELIPSQTLLVEVVLTAAAVIALTYLRSVKQTIQAKDDRSAFDELALRAVDYGTYVVRDRLKRHGVSLDDDLTKMIASEAGKYLDETSPELVERMRVPRDALHKRFAAEIERAAGRLDVPGDLK